MNFCFGRKESTLLAREITTAGDKVRPPYDGGGTTLSRTSMRRCRSAIISLPIIHRNVRGKFTQDSPPFYPLCNYCNARRASPRFIAIPIMKPSPSKRRNKPRRNFQTPSLLSPLPGESRLVRYPGIRYRAPARAETASGIFSARWRNARACALTQRIRAFSPSATED